MLYMLYMCICRCNGIYVYMCIYTYIPCCIDIYIMFVFNYFNKFDQMCFFLCFCLYCFCFFTMYIKYIRLDQLVDMCIYIHLSEDKRCPCFWNDNYIYMTFLRHISKEDSLGDNYIHMYVYKCIDAYKLETCCIQHDL